MANKTTDKTFRPEDLAASLGITGKVLRAELRKRYTRPATAKGTSWVITAQQAAEMRKHFATRKGTTKNA